MNRESLRTSLPALVAGAIPKNARQIHCTYFDDQPLRGAFGLRFDPRPAEGRVVTLTDEAFIVKTDRTRFAAVDLALSTLCPAVGDTVRVTPYCRRDFAGERLDAPREEIHQSADGHAYATTTVTLGGKTARIPLPAEPQCPYLADLVEQLEILPTPDGLRTIANMLVDAGAKEIGIVDPDGEHVIATPPEISFAIETEKFAGRVAVIYDRGWDYYAVELRFDGIVVKRVGEVDVMCLAETLAELIDDGQWRRIRVEVLKPGR